MRYKVHNSLAFGVLVLVFLFVSTGPASGVILHPAGEPNLLAWTDKPDSNVVGRWSSNASFVVIAPNWIITTRHQGTSPNTVTLQGNTYTCYYKSEWTGGPDGNADIRLIRLTTAEGENPNLPYYTGPYISSDETGAEIVIGGYGDGRGLTLQKLVPPYGYITYGYRWDNSSNTTQRWGTNKIDDTNDDNYLSGYTSDILIGDFDGLSEGDSTDYECAGADHDSGGGWFIYDGNEWKVAGLSRAVAIHYAEGHEGEHEYLETWFRYRSNPVLLYPDYRDAVRISSYAEWIAGIINVAGDITGDDWVDFADFSVLADQWGREDCDETNNWCEGADFEPSDGRVDWIDLAFLAKKWLRGWEY